MNLTPYHAKFLAHQLTLRQPADNLDKFTASLQDAQVDLNPHQVDAALFAFKSPLSNGAILADEVGLGKTIEAGIILSQQWAERKRKLLIIAPSNLRKQWNQELADKFFLTSVILEAKSFNKFYKEGNSNPFLLENSAVAICSYQFARSKEKLIRETPWDLVIIDEAHRLRNVYKPNNKIGNAIKDALKEKKKVLLTATPLQNSILELFGLVSIIDEYTFGDLKSFKSQYVRQTDKENFASLRSRLKPICHRTLRRQVNGYINFTSRYAMVEKFESSNLERQLYNGVSEYLQRDNLYALPSQQRKLMTLILRKLLASSSHAIKGTLDALIAKLENKVGINRLEEDLATDFEIFDELEESWTEETDESAESQEELLPETIEEIKNEISDLKQFRLWAEQIPINTKSEHLITALNTGFEGLQQKGALTKALIFTESCRTQDYLYKFLCEAGKNSGWKVMVFNGTNNDSASNTIYRNWIKKYKDTDRVTGSPTADKRAALVDYFRNEANIMIATEAAAEGINLQFCSLVVNYDLPWNPQRIEQRIGRCHRYGQQHDVAVVNFIDQTNAADQRVYQLLDEKFKLFNGVFGASDEVLGEIGSGIDFEKRIAEIYNNCRYPEAIQDAFNVLREELRFDITERMEETRLKLLENMDEEVRNKLRMDFEKTKGYLNVFQQNLWKLTRYFLQDYAVFSNDDYSFSLSSNPFLGENIHPGPYMILDTTKDRKKSEIVVPEDTNVYRIGHPLAQRILNTCKEAATPAKRLVFDYNNTGNKITQLEEYIGKSGWLQVSLLYSSSFDEEEHLVVAACTDDKKPIDADLAKDFFSILATEEERVYLPEEMMAVLEEIDYSERQGIAEKTAERNRSFFDAEIDKLDQWAEDMKVGLQREIEDLDAEIKLRKAEARKLLNLQSKVDAQRIIKDLEQRRSDKRRSLFEAQDKIDDQKDSYLTDVEKKLKQKTTVTELFIVQWEMI
jgi:ERCC4-related helicase